MNDMVKSVGWAVVLLVACGGGAASIKPGEMPQGGSYTGVYFSQQYGEMHLIQNGNAVHGEYKRDERAGTLAGEIDGDVLSFEWTELKAMVSNRPTETRGHGYFRYMIDPDSGDHVLKGRWGLGDDDESGGEWNAYKFKNREPQVGFATGGEKAAGSDEGSGETRDDEAADDVKEESSDDDLF